MELILIHYISERILKSINKIIVLLTIILFSINNNYCQTIATEHISIGDGLSSVTTSAAVQDKYGLLWFGTDDGLNRYDGYSFKVYKNIPNDPHTLIDNRIWDISIDKNEDLWIATQDGVSYFNRKENKFTNYDLDSLTAGKPQQFPKSVSSFIDSRGTVWIGSIWGGILRYNTEIKGFEKVKVNSELKPPFEAAYSMVESNGRLFVYHFGHGLVEFNREKDYFEIVKYISEGKDDIIYTDGDRISKLYVDHQNVLWIVSDFAIRKLDLSNSKIRTIAKFKSDKVFDVWRLFTGLTVDLEGNVWIGKDSRGIYKFDGISDDYKFIPFGDEYLQNPNTYTEIIRGMTTDRTGIIWFSTFTNGLFKHDPSSKPFVLYKTSSIPNSISGNEIFGLAESKLDDDLIYVGTRGAGLNKFYPSKQKFVPVKIKYQNDAFGGSARSIYESKDGSIYIGTWGDGLYKYSDKFGAKQVSKFEWNNNESLQNNSVRVLSEDSGGKLWVGTTSGLAIYDPVYNKVERLYTPQSKQYPTSLIQFLNSKNTKGESLVSISKVGNDEKINKSFSLERPRDYLIVSVGEGITTMNSLVDYGWLENEQGDEIWSAKSTNESYYLGGDLKNRITISIIRLNAGKYKLNYVSDDSHSYGKWNTEAPADSNLWGIQLFNLSNDEFTFVNKILTEEKNKFRISGFDIWAVEMSNFNRNIIWIGYANNGIDKYDKNLNTVKNYRYDSKNPNSLSNNTISCIYESKNGILWIGTNFGLNKFDPKTEKFTVYTEEDGLPTNYISSIQEDDFGNLWISTRNGISRVSFSEDRLTFVNYDAEDGLGGSDFISRVGLKSSTGKLYFGGEHGLNEITPGSINTNPPTLLLTDIKLGSKSIMQMGDDSPLNTSIYDASEITLNYDQNDISFEFAALHFARSDKNQYAHRLEGYEDEWHYDNRKYASYTNLDPGEYKFVFRGSNSEGVWNNEGKSILVKILPPWWKTTWAYIGYFFLFAGFVFGLDRIQRRRLLTKVKEKRRLEEAESRAKNAELQAKAAEAEKKVLEIEFNHKKKELEEARELQLSMLPDRLPQIPNLDIAVYMKTATEVGGDYYDFHVGMDGTLTVVLGDATGHGMKAGTMVTAVKGLFNSYSSNPDILYSFHEISRCIKQMRLGKLSMCMTMLKINKDKLIMSAAGMPPIMIYKSDERNASEEVIKGMPLGTFDNYPYDIRKMDLNKGDTILLMSDGLPELQNKKGEQFGYQKVRNIFENNAQSFPEEIIEKLKNEGSAWSGDQEPDDDITFVVIKVK